MRNGFSILKWIQTVLDILNSENHLLQPETSDVSTGKLEGPWKRPKIVPDSQIFSIENDNYYIPIDSHIKLFGNEMP